MYNKSQKKLVIGLTGGIGSGKSIAAQEFATLGIDIIDADKISREIIKPNSFFLKKIVSKFGDSILTPDGNLDRLQMRKKIFIDKEDRIWLENLLHPPIKQTIKQRADRSKSPYCILLIPLLIETGTPYDFIDRILVVDTPEDLQIERVKQRDNLSELEIKKMIQAQTSRSQRLSLANDIIRNFDSLDNLNKQVHKLHSFYLSLLDSDPKL